MKTINRFTLGFLFLIFTSLPMLHAQSWQWANHYGGANGDGAGNLCLDKNGNVYIFGQFFFPYAVFGKDTLVPRGVYDMFIMKMTPSGNVLWVKQAGSVDNKTNSTDVPGDLMFDESTNTIILAGMMNGDNGAIVNCNVGGGDKIFLAKLDLNGNCLWARGVAWHGDANNVSISNDADGNIFMAGNTKYKSTFDTNTIQPGVFIAKFELSGSLIWVKRVLDVNGVAGQVRYFNNNLYVGGVSYNDTLKLGSSTVVCNPNDPFISKFDTNCNVIWVKTMGGPLNDNGGTISIDETGNIYTTGEFQGTANFDKIVLENGNKRDWYIAKYDNNGKALWAKNAHITGNLIYTGISATTSTGNIYACGTFSGKAVFGDMAVSASSSREMFSVSYNRNGECLGVIQSPNSYHGGIASDQNGSVLLCGSFTGTTNFGNQTLKSFGASDVYISKHDAITSTSQPLENPQPQLLIYANPTTGKCTVTIPEEFLHEKQLTLQVFDFQGKLIEKTVLTLADGKIRLNLEAHAKGIYQVVVDNGRKSYTGKVVFE
ncbi:MAG: T9SS type A sorting domain-containing protein [Bacteroidetes bacterium]|nr:T9SS type A sorting domain-containing protein [Bacteroidota bacterium]